MLAFGGGGGGGVILGLFRSERICNVEENSLQPTSSKRYV